MDSHIQNINFSASTSKIQWGKSFQQMALKQMNIHIKTLTSFSYHTKSLMRWAININVKTKNRVSIRKHRIPLQPQDRPRFLRTQKALTIKEKLIDSLEM